jgi:hypothetical protein
MSNYLCFFPLLNRLWYYVTKKIRNPGPRDPALDCPTGILDLRMQITDLKA